MLFLRIIKFYNILKAKKIRFQIDQHKRGYFLHCVGFQYKLLVKGTQSASDFQNFLAVLGRDLEISYKNFSSSMDVRLQNS